MILPDDSEDRALTDHLQAALRRLKKQNSMTSIRGLAAQLGLSPSYLSKVFRGERRVSARLLARLVKALRLDHHETLQIQHLMLKGVESRNLAPVTGIQTLGAHSARSVTDDFTTLSADDFWLLEDWYHLPLLNLVTTENFVNSPTWMAEKLGLSVDRVERSLARMRHEGFVQTAPDGSLLRTQRKVRFPTQRSAPQIRGYHRAMLGKTVKVLERVPSERDFAQRLISGITLPGIPRVSGRQKF